MRAGDTQEPTGIGSEMYLDFYNMSSSPHAVPLSVLTSSVHFSQPINFQFLKALVGGAGQGVI